MTEPGQVASTHLPICPCHCRWCRCHSSIPTPESLHCPSRPEQQQGRGVPCSGSEFGRLNVNWAPGLRYGRRLQKISTAVVIWRGKGCSRLYRISRPAEQKPGSWTVGWAKTTRDADRGWKREKIAKGQKRASRQGSADIGWVNRCRGPCFSRGLEKCWLCTLRR